MANEIGQVEAPSFPSRNGRRVKVPVSLNGDQLDKPEEFAMVDLHGSGPLPRLHTKWRRNQYYAAFAANLGAISFGTIMGWSATALPHMREDKLGQTMTLDQESWIGSIVLLGALVSGPIIGFPMERFGRRRSILLLSLPCIFGWALIYFARNVWMIYAGRFITGITGGSISVVAPIYIAEISDPDIRGKLSAGFDMGVAFGVFYIVVIGSYFSWEIQTLACACITVVGHILMMTVPESPRYFISWGMDEEAVASFCWLQNVSNPTLVQDELDQLKSAATSYTKGKSESNACLDLLHPHILRPCSVALMLHLVSSLSAVTAISAFTVDIFASAGTSLDAYQATIIFAVSDGISGVLAAFMVDRFGRRPLLAGAQLVMTICFGALGAFFFLMQINADESPKGLGWLPLVSLGLYIFAFSLGTGPISYIMMGEILPPEAKGLAASVITVVKWLSAFLVTKYFLDILEVCGNAVGYWIFGGLCLLGGAYVLCFVPETNGKTLEEIQLYYSKKRKLPQVLV